ncbi:ATP-dependent DNA helicase [Actinomycetaceae bacterium MB13-C1-2]|nr:ATP-dependent DNA helicase [Actinomycetaceae bacterium MB13-C1-2]
MKGKIVETQQGHAALMELVDRLSLKKPTEEQSEIAVYPPYVSDSEGEVAGQTREGQQRTAQPLLVVAGAGSGKTETLSLRATYIAATYGVSPENILGLTFTRKAAAELEQRLRSRLRQWNLQTGAGELDVLAGSPEATTYNGFALSVVREFGGLVGIDPGINHLGEAAAWQLMSEIIAGWRGDLSAGSMETVTDNALRLRQDIMNQAMTVRQARSELESLCQRFADAEANPSPSGGRPRFITFHRNGKAAVEARLQLLDIIDAFNEQIRVDGYMDFADQVQGAIAVVEQSAEAREILRERHQIVFLDEFQDTSVSQMRFLSALFSDHPVTAVGDPNQAIYGWRGASAASLDDFHSLFNKNRDVLNATLTLSTAWRNDQLILDVANRVAAPLSEPPSWIIDKRNAGTGPVRNDQSVALPVLTARRNVGPGSVTANYFEFQDQSIADTVEFIRSVREQDPGSSAAVLGRTSKILLRVVEALREAGLPAQLASGEALLSHPMVVDLRAALEVTTDIGRSDSLARLLTNLDLGVSDLRALSDLARHLAYKSPGDDRRQTLILEAVSAIGEGHEPDNMTEVARGRIAGLASRLESMRHRRDRSITEQIDNARWVFGLDSNALADPTSSGVSEVLDQFSQIASDYESGADRPTMEAFLEWVSVAEQQERGIALPSVQIDPDAIQVMTVHAAKGLEWDAVAVVDLTSGGFPSYRGGEQRRTEEALQPEAPTDPKPTSGWWTDQQRLPFELRADHRHLPNPNYLDMEAAGGGVLETEFKDQMGEYVLREERRLAYVAFTRAKKWLHLSGAWNRGGASVYLPSAFLTEAADVNGVRSTMVLSPTREQIEEHRAETGNVSFPRDPGVTRRAAEQAAARVLESMKEIERHSEDGGDRVSRRERVLASVESRGLANTVSRLLADRDARESEALNADDRPEIILRRVGQVRELNVTELAQYERDPRATANELLRPIPKPPGDQSLLGTAFHRWIELYLGKAGAASSDIGTNPEFESDDPANGLLVGNQMAEALPPSERERFKRMRDAFLAADPLDGLEVEALEVAFWVPTGEIPVRGRIDAVLRDNEGNYKLIDWKTTGRSSRSLSADWVRYYIAQLSQYVAAWKPRADEEGVGISAELLFIAPDGTQRITLDQLLEMES